MAVPGVEGRHTWAGLLTLNDLSVWPRFKLRPPITGLRDRGDFDLSAATDIPVGRMGEIARRGYRRGKTVVYEGDVQGRTLTEVQEGVDDLLEAFDTDEEEEMVSAQHPSYGSTAYTWRARCADCQVLEAPASPRRAQTAGHERPFLIALRMSDARFYATAEQLAITAALATTSGLAPPFVPPVVIPSSAAAGAVTVTTNGRTDTDPTIDLYGPVTNPAIENTTLDKQVRLIAGIAQGQFVRLDFAKRAVKINGTDEASGFLDRAASDWWDAGVPGLRKGANTLRYTGDTIADPAVAEVRWHDAFLS